MKITKRQLKQIIKEEISAIKLLREGSTYPIGSDQDEFDDTDVQRSRVGVRNQQRAKENTAQSKKELEFLIPKYKEKINKAAVFGAEVDAGQRKGMRNPYPSGEEYASRNFTGRYWQGPDLQKETLEGIAKVYDEFYEEAINDQKGAAATTQYTAPERVGVIDRLKGAIGLEETATITKSQLRQIIKEEVGKVLKESDDVSNLIQYDVEDLIDDGFNAEQIFNNLMSRREDLQGKDEEVEAAIADLLDTVPQEFEDETGMARL